MDEAYREARIEYSYHRPISRNAVWVLVSAALGVGAYLWGVRNGSAAAFAFLTSSSHALYRTPARAEDPMPIGPNLRDSSEPGDLLARARLENELLYTDLQSFVCSERMDRYESRWNGEKSRHIDTIKARVSFENGVETYSDIQQNDRLRPALSNLVGAWSEGEFGTLLRQTGALLATQPVSVNAADLDGVPAALYRFYVSGEESPWDLTVSARQYRVPFRTDVWVSNSSGRIMKIARTTTATPPGTGISEIQWQVMLQPINIDGKTWLLPSSGEYSVQYRRSNHREWNTITFSDYHRYASQSVIHF